MSSLACSLLDSAGISTHYLNRIKWLAFPANRVLRPWCFDSLTLACRAQNTTKDNGIAPNLAGRNYFTDRESIVFDFHGPGWACSKP